MTPEMRETLTHFLEFYDRDGVSPSYRQLMEMANVSLGSIHRRIHALVERGYLVRTHRGARCFAPAKTDLRQVPTADLLTELERRRATHG